MNDFKWQINYVKAIKYLLNCYQHLAKFTTISCVKYYNCPLVTWFIWANSRMQIIVSPYNIKRWVWITKTTVVWQAGVPMKQLNTEHLCNSNFTKCLLNQAGEHLPHNALLHVDIWYGWLQTTMYKMTVQLLSTAHYASDMPSLLLKSLPFILYAKYISRCA